MRELGVPLQYVAPGRFMGGGHFLRHVGEAQVVHALDIATVRLQCAQQHGEQAGFAAAIGPDQGQFLPRLQSDAGALEQQFAAPPQFNIA